MPDNSGQLSWLAQWLLKKIIRAKDYDFAMGDLIEEFSSSARNQGKLRSWCRFWLEVLRSVPGFIKTSMYWSASMLLNYLKTATRNILRNRLFATINLLGLAVGMACFILISLWIQDELSYDNFHKNKEQLYQLTIKHPDDIIDPNVPYALAPALANEYPQIASYTRIFRLGNLVTCTFRYQPKPGQPLLFYEKNVHLVDRAFFSMFSFPFVFGNPETAFQERNSLVLRDEIASKYFGQENPMGKKLTFNNQQEVVVTGVVHVPDNSGLQFDFLAPLEQPLSGDWNWRDPSYVLLDKNSAIEDFRSRIVGSLNKHYPAPLPGTFQVQILPISKCHLSFGRMTYIYIFAIIGIFILMIACLNYMNLATACSSNRAREVGVRKVVGANRMQLIYQFLGESVFLTLLAIFLALLLAILSLPVLNSISAKKLTLLAAFNPYMVLFFSGLILIVGLMSGFYPAVFLSSNKPINALKASLHFKANRSLFRIVSVVGQFAISIILIIGTLVIFKQLHYIRKQPPGFKTDYVINVPMNPSLLTSFAAFKNELLKNPKILTVTASQAIPYDEDYKTSIDWDTKDPNLVPMVRYSITTLDYIETFEMQVVQGKSFSRDFPSDQGNYVVNEEAVRYMDLAAPIGQRLRFWGQEGEIIGVVKNFHHVSLHRQILPHVLTINPVHYRALKHVFMKINSTDIPATIKYIKDISGKFAANFPFEYSFLDQGINNLYQAEQRLGRVFSYFAFLAILISCLGIFGLAAFTAEQRSKEIGIRKVLGASVAGIMMLLSKEFSRWVLLANMVAWPVAWYAMTRWLENFAYHININIWMLLLAGMLALVISAVTVSYQSLKAATANPVDALKYE